MFNIFSYIFGSTTEPGPTESKPANAEENGQGLVDQNVATTTIVTPPSFDVTSALDTQSAVANDSGDIALMDESWYVTPPPCFTGEDKLNETKPKPKSEDAAARENALIEHPSIYIASSSKQLAPANSTKKNIAFQKPNLVRKSNRIQKMTEPATAPSEVADEKPASAIVKPTVKLDDLNKRDVQLEEETKQEDSLDKFVVINWNDEMDDIDDEDDFDNLFGSNKITEREDVKIVLDPEPIEPNTAAEIPEFNQEMQSLDVDQVDHAEDLLRSNQVAPSEEEAEIENVAPIVVGVNEVVEGHQPEFNKLEVSESVEVQDKPERKKPLVQKQPIKPERQPGWQLKKRRSKRQSMMASSTVISCKSSSIDNDSDVYGSSSNSSSSDRASPLMLNDRIGSRIVTNLNHLTSGLATTALPIPPRSCAVNAEADRLNQTVSRKMESCSVMATRKRMSKGYMDRQNGCTKVANSHRRTDRRKKMYTTPNGYSVNRKVHTSIH